MELDTKPQVFKSQNIILDNITFKKIYSVGNNIYNQPIKYMLKDLIIQTPIIYIPFGINSYNNKKYLDISLLNIECDPEMKEFKKFICSMNEQVKKKIKSKFKKGKHLMTFKNSLKKTTNNFFPDRIRLSINENILVYNDFKRKISFDCIQPKIYSKMLISPKCIWFTNKDFGIVWNILQVKIYDKLILDEYSFIDDDQKQDQNQNENKNHTQTQQYVDKDLENDERYKKYFRMLKMGVPSGAVKHKMTTDGINPGILDGNTDPLPEKPKNNILKELCNKITLNKINSEKNNKSVFTTSKKTIITRDMILGVKLNKSKPVKKKIVKDNKHFNPLISLDEIKSIRRGLTKIN